MNTLMGRIDRVAHGLGLDDDGSDLSSGMVVRRGGGCEGLGIEAEGPDLEQRPILGIPGATLIIVRIDPDAEPWDLTDEQAEALADLPEVMNVAGEPRP